MVLHTFGPLLVYDAQVMQYLAGRAGSKTAARGASADEDDAARPKNSFARLSDHGDAAPIEEQVRNMTCKVASKVDREQMHVEVVRGSSNAVRDW